MNLTKLAQHFRNEAQHQRDRFKFHLREWECEGCGNKVPITPSLCPECLEAVVKVLEAAPGFLKTTMPSKGSAT